MKRAVLAQRAVLASMGTVASIAIAIAVFLAPGRPDYWIPVVAHAAAPTYPPGPYDSRLIGLSLDDFRRGNDQTGIPRAVIVTTGPAATPSATFPSVPPGELGIPGVMLDAYRRAATMLGTTDPSCHLTWQMLAGIGRIETDHALEGRVYPDGRTFEPLIGIPIGRDTDRGVWDGDPVLDHAVGAMQFIPSTWRVFQADGNGDGVEDPSNVFDETVAAGEYLCIGSRDLANRPDLIAALYSYNYSDSYVAIVLAWIDGYTAGQVKPLPPQTPPPSQSPTGSPTSPTQTPTGSPTGTPTDSPTTGSPTPTYTTPVITASPTPSQTSTYTESASPSGSTNPTQR